MRRVWEGALMRRVWEGALMRRVWGLPTIWEGALMRRVWGLPTIRLRAKRKPQKESRRQTRRRAGNRD